MKRISICLLGLCLVVTFTSYAQVKPRYRAQNYIGLLEGEPRSAFQLQTSHGVQLGTWYTALGAGLDYYRYRSIPVFFTVNRDVTFNNRVFFISGDIGYNYPWTTEQTMSVWSWPTTDKFSGGVFWAGGLGYKAYFKNKSDAIVFNIGYSFKQLKEERTSAGGCFDPPCQVDTERFDYRMKRVSVRLGWQF
jgi:hypothetical protein